MKTKNQILLSALVAFSTLTLQLSTAFAQGSLTPPGAPAPTMKTLDQVEPRTPISSAPFTISASGSYYLTGNLAVTNGSVITVNADEVTLDLNGFAITSTASPASGTAVLLSGVRKNVTVKNGHIRGTTTFAAGTFTTGGFLDGITSGSVSGANLRVFDVSVFGLGDDGIDLATTSVPSLAVERCTVSICGGTGIQAALVRGCGVSTAGASAILADIAIDSTGESVGAAAANSGVSGFSSVDNCRGIANAGNGVQGDQVSNSFGSSTSGSGLSATCAFNSQGFSTSGSFGINTSNGTASFCRGQRNGGVAISAFNAIGCTVIGTGTVTAINKSLGTP